MTNPAFYSFIFRKIGVKRSVLDLNIQSGARALGACLAGLDYYVIDDHKLKYAIDHGIEEIGFKYNLYEGGKIDLVIADNDFGEYDLDSIDRYFSVANQVMAFVNHDNMETYKAKFKPRAILPFQINNYSKENQYYFIW